MSFAPLREVSLCEQLTLTELIVEEFGGRHTGPCLLLLMWLDAPRRKSWEFSKTAQGTVPATLQLMLKQKFIGIEQSPTDVLQADRRLAGAGTMRTGCLNFNVGRKAT